MPTGSERVWMVRTSGRSETLIGRFTSSRPDPRLARDSACPVGGECVDLRSPDPSGQEGIVVSPHLSTKFAIVGALVAGGVGFSPLSGAVAADESVAAHDFGDASAIYRPIADFLENNPQSFNTYGVPIGNTGSDATVLVNFGWNSHLFPTIDRNDVSHANYDVFGFDPFGFPGGFDSILSETEHPTKTKGFIRQTRLADGGVQIAIRARIKFGAVSIYDDEDIFGEGGVGSGGPGGCSVQGGSLGSGCNDLPGGSGEPMAIVGQDGDGRFDYRLSIDLTYTAEGVELAGGDLDAGINPTIAFILPTLFGVTPGVTVDSFTMDGKITGRVTNNAALAAKFGLNPGKKATFRYLDSPDGIIVDLIH